MMTIRTSASLIACAACAALGQTAAPPPAFEVASIKPAAPQPMGRMTIRMGGDPGRVDYENVSLRDVLARAYDLKRYQISGPVWLDTERYDIVAKVPDGVPKGQVPAMLQALLTERFQMKAHRETKDLPVYALTVGKNGPKLEKAEDAAATGGPPGGRMMVSTDASSGASMEAQGATLGALSDMLSNMLDRPVVDMTGIQGNYNIKLKMSMDDMAGMKRDMAMAGPGAVVRPGGDDNPAPDSTPAPSLFTAVQQLGLKLESRKAPVEFLVVDRAEKTPTEN
ncbi:MAG: TIGR03435 family protein [Bryobacteraceae bacterium]|jgi:uncharacterized protein (TIGR03435 family)